MVDYVTWSRLCVCEGPPIIGGSILLLVNTALAAVVMPISEYTKMC